MTPPALPASCRCSRPQSARGLRHREQPVSQEQSRLNWLCICLFSKFQRSRLSNSDLCCILGSSFSFHVIVLDELEIVLWSSRLCTSRRSGAFFSFLEIQPQLALAKDACPWQVGAAISMTYITSKPIVFVGTGQTYCDLRSLNAKAVVAALMKA